MPAPLLCSIVLALAAHQEGTPPPFLKPPSRVAVQASAEPSAGGRAWQIRLDVTPNAGIHVYAPGNKGYQAVTAALTAPPAALRAGSPSYPAGEPYVFGALKEVVQVYQQPFRIEIPVRARAARLPASDRRVTGVLRYQACTDRVCFPPQEEPFTVQLPAP
jgi:DsbC/DsbD-like thiol-disulfide interchange protein